MRKVDTEKGIIGWMEGSTVACVCLCANRCCCDAIRYVIRAGVMTFLQLSRTVTFVYGPRKQNCLWSVVVVTPSVRTRYLKYFFFVALASTIRLITLKRIYTFINTMAEEDGQPPKVQRMTMVLYILSRLFCLLCHCLVYRVVCNSRRTAEFRISVCPPSDNDFVLSLNCSVW
jgi:hypothetical protein